MNYIKNEVRTVSIAKIFYFSHEFDIKLHATYKRLKKEYFPSEYVTMFCDRFDLFFKDYQQNYKSVYSDNFGPFEGYVPMAWAVLYKLLERTNNKASLLGQCAQRLSSCSLMEFGDIIKDYHEQVVTPFVDEYEVLVNTIRVFEQFDNMLDVPYKVFDNTLTQLYECLFEENTPARDLKYNTDCHLPEAFKILRDY